ncbi:hypothetical protein NRB_23010 [Novosphingobium sp. 11B]
MTCQPCAPPPSAKTSGCATPTPITTPPIVAAMRKVRMRVRSCASFDSSEATARYGTEKMLNAVEATRNSTQTAPAAT